MSPADAAYFDGCYADFDKRIAEAEKRWDGMMARLGTRVRIVASARARVAWSRRLALKPAAR